MNSQKRIVTVAFKKNFLTKIEDMHTEFKKDLVFKSAEFI